MRHYQSDISLERRDNEFLGNFCTSMSKHLGDEQTRTKLGNSLLSGYLGKAVGRSQAVSSLTDGSIVWNYVSETGYVDGGLPPTDIKMAVLNIEYKNEIGSSSGDPSMQNIGYFVQWLKECGLDGAHSLRLPMLLVSIVGSLIAVYGAIAYGKMIHCDPLTPYLHLLPIVDDNHSWRNLGRAMQALKLSIPKLEQYYYDLLVKNKRTPYSIPAHPFPYIQSVKMDTDETIQFTYLEPLGRRVFSGVIPATERKIVLKFVQSVQDIDSLTRGQRVLASIGSAPQLIAFVQLPPDWTLFVSEFVEDTSHYEPTPERNKNLIAALNCLHELKIVHGDVRANNVLVVPRSPRVIFVDFEFCGLDGIGRYPDRLNHTDITWPDGATDGAPLRVHHDIYFANLLMGVRP